MVGKRPTIEMRTGGEPPYNGILKVTRNNREHHLNRIVGATDHGLAARLYSRAA